MLIGEVARRSGVSARMLRHYESLGLLRPTGRRGTGYREYSVEDIRRIFHIESLRSLGLSLREVGRALDDPGFQPAELVGDLIRQTQDRIAAESELLTRLRRIDGAGPGRWEDVLEVVALLRALGSDDAGERQTAALSAAEKVPAEALAEAALHEPDTHVAGALRWALARTGDGGLPRLAEGLSAGDPEVRRRAVRAVAAIPGAAADSLLREVCGDPDTEVRTAAVLALGNRGELGVTRALLDMIVTNTRDADAADTLSALAATPARAATITTDLVACLTIGTDDPAARQRLTQALADIPGAGATRALTALAGDADRAVALTATYVLKLRDA